MSVEISVHLENSFQQGVLCRCSVPLVDGKPAQTELEA